MERRRPGRPPRQHERAQGLQLRVHRVDFILEARHLLRHDTERLIGEGLAAVGQTQVRAEVEEIVLDTPEDRVDVEGKAEACKVHPRHADDRVGLVDRAVGGDAQTVLAHALAAAERRRPFVARAGVDLVQNNHGATPSVSG